LFLFVLRRPPPPSTLFPYTTLFRSVGGSASSRLFQEIREKRGMAYSVYSFGSQYADSGLVGLYVGTREENLAECLEIAAAELVEDRKSTRLNSSHVAISYAVFCLKK